MCCYIVNKVNATVHATTGEIPFERLKKEGLSPLKREDIIVKRQIDELSHGVFLKTAKVLSFSALPVLVQTISKIGIDNTYVLRSSITSNTLYSC